MSPETVLSIANTAVLPLWALLLLTPRFRWAPHLITAVIAPGLIGIAYTWFLLTGWGSAEGGFGSISEIRKLFQSDPVLVAGWLHYLAFDLFIGSWEVRDSQKLKISHFLVIPCLVFTLLAGPMGLLMYLLLRAVVGRKWTLDTP